MAGVRGGAADSVFQGEEVCRAILCLSLIAASGIAHTSMCPCYGCFDLESDPVLPAVRNITLHKGYDWTATLKGHLKAELHQTGCESTHSGYTSQWVHISIYCIKVGPTCCSSSKFSMTKEESALQSTQRTAVQSELVSA